MTVPADPVAAHEEWVAHLPAGVQVEARRLYPDSTVNPAVVPWCVRSTTNPGHYLVESFHSGDDQPVTLKVAHAHDSYLPGVAVFDVPAAELVPCGCGMAAPPSAVQTAYTGEQVEAKLSEAKAVAAAAGLDWDTLTPAERRTILWGDRS